MKGKTGGLDLLNWLCPPALTNLHQVSHNLPLYMICPNFVLVHLHSLVYDNHQWKSFYICHLDHYVHSLFLMLVWKSFCQLKVQHNFHLQAPFGKSVRLCLQACFVLGLSFSILCITTTIFHNIRPLLCLYWSLLTATLQGQISFSNFMIKANITCLTWRQWPYYTTLALIHVPTNL